MAVTQTLNRSDAEKVLFTFTNAEGAQLTNGDVIEWDLTAPLGVACELSDSVAATLVCGVVVETVDTGAVGRAQRWGYHSAVKTTTTVTAETCVQADTSGKCRNFATSTTDFTSVSAAQQFSIIGVVNVVNDTNTAGIHLRL